MKTILAFLFLALSISLRAEQTDIQVFFSPNGGCTAAVVSELSHAKKTVLVQAYSFTSSPIAKALVEAHKRGVDVKLILDKSNRTQKYSAADFMVHEGIPTWIDPVHAIAHYAGLLTMPGGVIGA